ncbi:MAG: hypothetical protein IJ060_03145 [Oscillospiraceae bacterium]|nr:hypothetical protein [Oscillospiraceae bacterium]
MKTFLKEHKGFLIAVLLLLAAGSAWLLLWRRISKGVDRAAYEESFTQLVYGGAYYELCDAETLRLYLGDDAQIDRALCGTQLGEISVPTTEGAAVCALYACKPLEDAGKEKAVILLDRGAHVSAYELTGFQYLDDNPSIWAVCASYGIGDAADLESVRVCDSDGTELAVYTDEASLGKFFDQFVKLGENLSESEAEQAYLDAYAAEYGNDGGITIQEGSAASPDDETYQRAMTLWSEGVCKVDIVLRNGLQLRNCVYAPKPGLFTVYGTYRFETPFFA